MEPAEDHAFDVATEPEPPHSHKKTVVAGGVVLALFVAVGAFFFRGTWTDDNARDPKESRDGIVCQLLKAPDGEKQIRCASVMDLPAEKAWAVITDYDHFTEIFPYLTQAKATLEPDGRYRFSGVVTSQIGTWDVEVHMKHDVSAAASVASWDEPGGRFKVNRGSWTVTPLGPSKTLVVYEIELRISPYPTFVLRNVLLTRLPLLLKAVEDRATRERK